MTAYDSVFGRIADAAGVDLILVGDSVASTVMGHRDTIRADLPTMAHHTRAVREGVKRAFLLGDLPFGSYQTSIAEAVSASVELMKAGAQGVKLEGDYADQVRAIVKAGIPTMGHLGMTPQAYHKFGGFKVQGRSEGARRQIMDSALRLQDAGAFGLVLELIPADLACEITESLDIPTIGIGAGPDCSGEIQVIYDILGFGAKTHRHAHRFAEVEALILQGLQDYSRAVREKSFPSEDQSF